MTTLVQVNGYEFELAEGMRRLMINPHRDELLNYCVTELLLRQYAAQNGISYTFQELEAAKEEFSPPEEYKVWRVLLSSLTPEERETYINGVIEGKVLQDKVKASIKENEIAAYFVEHQLGFEGVELYSIRLGNKDTAEEIYAKITEDGENFHLLALEYSLDEESKPKGGYVGKLSRSELTAEIEAAVFGAHPEEIVGPIKTEKGYNLFKVGAVYPADLDSCKETIREELYLTLIAQLRSKATVIYPCFEGK